VQNSETLTIGVTVIVSFLSYCFGINPALEFLLWAITLDIFIGVLASFINPRLYFNSRKMFRGIAKKIILLSIVAFSHQLDQLMHTDIICLTTTYYFIINEGLSCLENAGKCNIKLPKIIQTSLEQLKGLADYENKNR
jgi:toxin secretion/phage lysis holin